MSKELDKYKLIFQFNNNSPLFARIADGYIKNFEFNKAAEILENGLKLFPDYVTANLLYAICLANLQKLDEAKSLIEKTSAILDSEETKLFYMNKIDEIAFGKGIPKNLSSELINEAETKIDTSIDEELTESTAKQDEDDLEQLVQKLEGTKINLKPENASENIPEDSMISEENSLGKSLVSETLAKIYLNQGNYSEALSLYRNLIEIQPERSKYYQSQIDYIQKILEAERK